MYVKCFKTRQLFTLFGGLLMNRWGKLSIDKRQTRCLTTAYKEKKMSVSNFPPFISLENDIFFYYYLRADSSTHELGIT